MIKIVSIVLLLSSLAAANPFASGNANIGITAGSGSVSYSRNVENYYILGVNADFFVVENLAVGLGYRGWFGGDPIINQGTIPVTYYIPTNSAFRPYVGAFYRYTFVDGDYDNYSSAGARAGLAITFKGGYFGFGWAQEYYLDADNLSDDTSGYPEMVVGFSF